jgi:phospholipid/cholesterol/gamma-HCH transport system substrate-binding protein
VLACTVALSGCEAYDLPLPGSPVDEEASFEVTAEFRDVLDLVPRSPVKVNDVTVGEVVELTRDGWHAQAVLRLQDDVKLSDNVVADIRQTSLLGEKYVALEEVPGEPARGTLEDGDVLTLKDTGRNPELEEVLGALAFLLNGGGVSQLKTITTEINAILDGRQGRVRHVLRELETLVGGLDAQKDDIIGAMEAMNGLARTLNREKDTVTAAIDEFGPAVTVLADQHQQLMRMLRALDRLGAVGKRVIGASKEAMIADLRSLEPTLRELADAGGEIPDALELLISFPFPIESNNIVYGDYANTSIVFSVDFDNLYRKFVSGNEPGEDGGGGLPIDPDDLLPGGGQLPQPQLPQLGPRGTGPGGSAGGLDELLGGGGR